MLSTQTVQETIDMFNLYTDDSTELATAECILVINKVLRKIGKERDWYWLQKNYTSTLTDYQVALPTDFHSFMSNNGSNDMTMNVADQAVVYVGNNPFKIIPYSLQNDPNYQGDFAYTDTVNIYVPNASTDSINYSYKSNMGQVTALTDVLPIPKDHEECILYGMLVDDIMIQKIDALSAMLPQTISMYQEHMSDLRYHNSKYFTF
jgi:hypothetical protein